MSEETPDVRVTDAERAAAIATLRHSVGEGVLTLDEFGDRTGAALAATTRGELDTVTKDLPRRVDAPASSPRRWIFGLMGGGDRSGRWRVPARLRVVNVMGGADLDLRTAVLSSEVTEITVISVMGGSDIIVPPGVEVDLSGFALMGSNDLRTEGTAAASPMVRVRAFSLMGGTDVISKAP